LNDFLHKREDKKHHLRKQTEKHILLKQNQTQKHKQIKSIFIKQNQIQEQ
jgi:uncharacterized protein with PIN domain